MKNESWMRYGPAGRLGALPCWPNGMFPKDIKDYMYINSDLRVGDSKGSMALYKKVHNRKQRSIAKQDIEERLIDNECLID